MILFLTILKWIGIILLCILELILLILLLTLFSPLTYNVYVEGSKESFKVQAKLGWFLYIIRPIIIFEDNELSVKVRFFGIPINLSGGKKKEKPVPEPEKADKPAETEVIKEDLPLLEENETEVIESVEASEITMTPEPEEIIEEPIEAKEGIKEDAPKKKGILDKIKGKFKKGGKKPKLTEEEKQKLKEEKERLKAEKKEEKRRKKEETRKKVEEGIAKAKKIWAYLQEDETKEAIALIKDVTRKTIRHIMPRRFKGHVNLGFVEPDITGNVLAAVAGAYPIHRGNIGITPYFETDKTIIDGEARIRGHIFVIFFVVQGIRILKNKRIMSLVKSLRSGGLK